MSLTTPFAPNRSNMGACVRSDLGVLQRVPAPTFLGLVAVGDSGRVITSSNGITWVSQTSGNSDLWLSVAFSPTLGSGQGRFCAVSFTGTTMYSDNLGVTWTLGTAASSNEWSSICWGNGQFVAVSLTGSGTNSSMYSSDGITFSSGTTPNSNQYEAVCFAPELGLYVAVAANGNFFQQTMSSGDGQNWVEGAAIPELSLAQWRAICWNSNNQTFVVGSGSTSQSLTGSDGSNWLLWNTLPSAMGFYGMCWSASKGIYVGVQGSQAGWSTNGQEWTLGTYPSSFHDWQSVIWSEKLQLFVAVGLNALGNVVNLSSPDGKVWTARGTTSMVSRCVCEGFIP